MSTSVKVLSCVHSFFLPLLSRAHDTSVHGLLYNSQFFRCASHSFKFCTSIYGTSCKYSIKIETICKSTIIYILLMERKFIKKVHLDSLLAYILSNLPYYNTIKKLYKKNSAHFLLILLRVFRFFHI